MARMSSLQILIKQFYIISLPLILFGSLNQASAREVQINISQKNTPSSNQGSQVQASKVDLPDKFIAKPISKPQEYLDLAQKVPKNIGAPTGRRKGGSTRNPDQCSNLQKPITALVPGAKKDEKEKSFFALTVAEYPSIWLFIPQLAARMKFGEFVLQDKDGNDVLRERMILPRQAGVISISVPQNPQYALKENHKYQWYFQVYCDDPQIQRGYVYVDAWLQRVAPTPRLQQQLKIAKESKYAVYSQNHLWYDAITDLARLRDRNPASKHLAQDWAKLLKSVDLEELVDMPIIRNYVLQE